MSFEDYKKKRDVSRTPEPPGETRPTGGGSYCIQKHAASRLHYDFRLEWGGVLLSWAVPKGPSFDPRDKRLAMRVEDHPVDYGSFEGVIPDGEYGAGAVVLWDRGAWTPVLEPGLALKKGELKFQLHGAKLRLADFAGTVRGRLPQTQPLALAMVVEAPPDGDDWLHEIKHDGYRIVARLEEGEVRLISRNGKDWTKEFPQVARAVGRLPAGTALLDGEVAAVLPNGATSFRPCSAAPREGRRSSILPSTSCTSTAGTSGRCGSTNARRSCGASSN